MVNGGTAVLQARESAVEQALASGEVLVAKAAQSLVDHLDLCGGADGCALIRIQGARSRVLAASSGLPWHCGQVLTVPSWLSASDDTALRVVSDASRCAPRHEVAAAPDTMFHSAVVAPVVVHGEVVAALVAPAFEPPAEDLQGSARGTEALAALLGVLWEAHVTAALARAEAAAMEQLARSDALTGLPNRRGWQTGLHREDLRRARHGHDVAVVVVDLDELKPVNDQFGHAVGDQVIRAAAETLRGVIRGEDLLARTGGDEFSILAVHCTGGVESIRQRVVAGLAEAGVRASVGAALAQRPDGDLMAAWQQADLLMYQAKRERGRARSGQ